MTGLSWCHVCFKLPFTLDTDNGPQTLNHTDRLRQEFEGLRNYFQENGFVDMRHVVRSAEFISDDSIGVTHTLTLLDHRGVECKRAPKIYSIVTRADDFWKVKAMSITTDLAAMQDREIDWNSTDHFRTTDPSF